MFQASSIPETAAELSRSHAAHLPDEKVKIFPMIHPDQFRDFLESPFRIAQQFLDPFETQPRPVFRRMGLINAQE